MSTLTNKLTAKTVLLGIASLAVIAAIFYGGVAYQKHKTPKVSALATASALFNRQLFGGGMGSFGRRGNVANNATNGKITAIKGTRFTIDVSGTSKTVQTSSSTQFVVSSISGLASGDQVAVFGTTDSSGVIQAVRVSANPSTTSPNTTTN